MASDLEWAGYLAPDWPVEFPPGSSVLDVGCGEGRLLQKFLARGHRVRGVEPNPAAVAAGRAAGVDIVQGVAESLPEPDASWDAVVCRVVLPYTDEPRAVAEIGRVLRPGGRAFLLTHGAGYSLRYLLLGPTWRLRFYGMRSLVNTWLWVATGRRLPGFLGDTLFQSGRRLNRYFRAAGLSVLRQGGGPRFAGLPVFLYHDLSRGA